MGRDVEAPAPHVFGLVVPVKRVPVAKSRLQPLGEHARRALVTAFAVDTVSAALDCPLVGEVLVVTDEAELARGFRELGVAAVPDGESGSLNASLRQGAEELLRRRPELVPAALCADLPALRADELTVALRSAAGHYRAAFVADAAGSGTTLYTARRSADFEPRFGTRSRSAHLAAGAHEVVAAGIDSVRRDVDTPEDLRAAAALGLGPRTSFVVTSMRLLDD